MHLFGWNVGLEIHNDCFVAVALQKKRDGWQLRGWWKILLNQPVYNRQGLFNPKLLIAELQRWRKLLPKIISLRLVLPHHLVLQHPLKLPSHSLSPQELEWYVEASVNKLFPLSAKELAIDYRIHNNHTPSELLITATRQTELTVWIKTLQQAGLAPEAIDITPCILRVIAHYSAVPKDNLLIHLSKEDCLFVSPLSHDFYFEHISLSGEELYHYKDFALQRYKQISNQPVQAVSISGDFENYLSSPEIHYWSPFSAIRRVQPPMPQTPSVFTIPCGLALREIDNVSS